MKIKLSCKQNTEADDGTCTEMHLEDMPFVLQNTDGVFNDPSDAVKITVGSETIIISGDELLRAAKALFPEYTAAPFEPFRE